MLTFHLLFNVSGSLIYFGLDSIFVCDAIAQCELPSFCFTLVFCVNGGIRKLNGTSGRNIYFWI